MKSVVIALSDPKERQHPSMSTDSSAFMRQRIALFGLATGALGVTFFAFRLVVLFVFGRLSVFHPSMLFHAGGFVPLLLLWFVARGVTWHWRVVHAIEILALTLSTASYMGMCITLPVLVRPDYILILALGLVLIARSILVPSTPLHTAGISLLMGLLLLAGVFSAFRGAALPALPASLALEHAPGTAILRATIWWLLLAGLSVLTSHVTYGLRKEVDQARRLGQYSLEEKLGEGGMGVVYRASHAMLRRPTAIKLLAPERAGAETIARFEREVRLTARLTHPNTVTIYDYGRTPEGIFYYAMELLDGATLEEIVEVDGPQPPARVIHIGRQIASALVEAHSIGLIHRDVKPANAILCERGGVPDVAKVVDFGLVREMDSNSTALSRTGAIAGTPLYLAPEAILHPEEVDARADLYALGAVLYYLLAGDHVFGGETTIEACGHHLHTAPPPIASKRGAAVAEDIEAVVMDCLRKRPEDRLQKAEDVLERLDGCAAAQGWMAADARRWWEEHGPTIRAHRARKSSSMQSRIAVDLGGR